MIKSLKASALIFFSIITLCTGCKKNEQEPQGFSIENLYGSWYFMTLEFDGKSTFGCDSALSKNYNFTTIDLINVKYNFWSGESSMILNSSCPDIEAAPWQKYYSFTFSDSIINCNEDWKFKILEISPFEYTTYNVKVQSQKMRLKLIYSSFRSIPLNGIYTVGKSN